MNSNTYSSLKRLVFFLVENACKLMYCASSRECVLFQQRFLSALLYLCAERRRMSQRLLSGNFFSVRTEAGDESSSTLIALVLHLRALCRENKLTRQITFCNEGEIGPGIAFQTKCITSEGEKTGEEDHRLVPSSSTKRLSFFPSSRSRRVGIQPFSSSQRRFSNRFSETVSMTSTFDDDDINDEDLLAACEDVIPDKPQPALVPTSDFQRHASNEPSGCLSAS